jgi:alanyl-tRNA synthetase
MMSDRLYYSDAYVRTFDARVLARVDVEGRPAVILDRTAFYPEGGGQPSDRGTLDQVRVIDVIERDGAVLHVLSEPLAADRVAGVIDGPRRFDLMQQHTGQHILSEAFIQTAHALTVAFHLNPDPDGGALTIDLNTPQLTPEQLDRAEEVANQIVWENRPVIARFVTGAEVATLPLRAPRRPPAETAIRVVEVAGFDWSACGGTHVVRTGEIGLIKIVKVERRGRESRVEFRCGGRALLDYRRKHTQLSRAAADLSVGLGELDQAIGRLQTEAKVLRKQLAEADRRLLGYEAGELLNAAPRHGGYRLIAQTWLNRDAAYLKRLAQLLIAPPGTVALLGAQAGTALALVFARSKDVPLDLTAPLQAAAAQLGAKGGGSPDFAQAGGPAVNEAQLKAALDRAVEQLAAEN